MHIRFFAVVVVVFVVTAIMFLSHLRQLEMSDFVILTPLLLLAIAAIYIFVGKNKEVLNDLTQKPSEANMKLLKKLFFGKK